MKEQFAVFGSDARQAAAGRALARAGYAVGGAEAACHSTICFCPCRWMHSSWGFAVCCGRKAGALALGSLPGPDACRIAQQCGIELVDYYQEPLALRNAVAHCRRLHRSAAAPLTPAPWQGRRCWCWGFGRVGQALAVTAAPGARVTLAARSPAQRAHAKSGHDRRPLDPPADACARI